MKKRFWTVLLLCLTGVVLGALGTWSMPLGHGYSAFWPALVVQVGGGIWFGAWGVLAAVLFPMYSNAVTHVGLLGILGYMPANFAQAFIPAWAFRHYRMDPMIPGRKGVQFYLLWGALAPALAGGTLGSVAVVLFGHAPWSSFPELVVKWGLPHIAVSVFIGIPAMRVFTPLWREMQALVFDWWGKQKESAQPKKLRFADLPIQLKMILAMCASGFCPLLLLSGYELIRAGQSGPGQHLTPLALTLSLVVSILAVGFLSREVIRPLRTLQESVERLTRCGEGSLAISREDEIGQLGRSFEYLLHQRQKAELELRESEERYRCLANNTMFPVVVSTVEGRVLFANKNALEFFDFEGGDLSSIDTRRYWQTQEAREKLMPILIERGELRNAEAKMLTAKGEPRTVLFSCMMIYFAGQKSLLSIFSDITELKDMEEALRASLEEKTVLLKEVHHRVKNNLQIVSSLLGLQSAQTRNPEALEILKETANRIRAMALLHETLYRSSSLAKVEFRTYLEEICAYVMRSWGAKTRNITLEKKFGPVALGLDQAVPCGLIVNELVSNAVKHAFPENRPGQIVVELTQNESGLVTLVVRDNGVGLPDGMAWDKAPTLGLKLVWTLATQLRGKITAEPKPGAAFRLEFAQRVPNP